MKQVVMPFDGKVIETVTGEDGKPWISVRSVCQAIGVDFKTQSRKVQDDERLRGGHITAPSAGGPQEMLCIPLEQLNGWLFSIQPNRVREDIRPNLIRYQQECFQVLYNHFMPSGVQDLQPLMDKMIEFGEGLNQKLDQKIESVHEKLDVMGNFYGAMLGDDREIIEGLILEVANTYNVSGSDVWRYLQEQSNVASYKRQAKILINHLRRLLDRGLKLIASGKVGSLYE